MSIVSRGFQGRRRDRDSSGCVPPGQYVTTDFPVLSAGPTPHTPLEEWTFSILGGDQPVRWTGRSSGRFPVRRSPSTSIA